VLTLLLMRHAKSDWDHPGLPDIDRPLNKRGRRNAEETGGWLKDQGLVPELILVSPACRAQETVQLLMTGMVASPPLVRTIESLYPGSPTAILAAIGAIPASVATVLLVAHNPPLEIVVDMIGGKAEHFPTGAVADIEVPGRQWAAASSESAAFFGHCQLRQIWRPRELFEDSDSKKR
jgi:phosphohistidine phosphatase